MTSLPPLVMDREKNDVSVVKMGKDSGDRLRVLSLMKIQHAETMNQKKQKTGESLTAGPFSIVLLNVSGLYPSCIGRT